MNAGFYLALAAYSLWGLFPIYFRLLDGVPVFEFLAHRAIWCVFTMAIYLAVLGRLDEVIAAVKDRRTLLLLCASASVISINWLLFIWAIAAERVLEISFGYFINPLVSILFGVVLLSERLSKWQFVAVVIAAAAVIFQAIDLGRPPWIPLILAVTFAMYGLLKKRTNVRASPGFFVESIILLVPAIALLLFLGREGTDVYYISQPKTLILLMGTGVTTALPLVLFAAASRRLSLVILGMMQYLAPSIHLIIAVYLFHEPMGTVKFFSFVMIWICLIVFTTDIWARQRQITAKTAEE
jgi:chloramphenicol-sensitive protein RarD